MEITLYSGIGDIPLFNPDLESALPAAVNHFRTAIAQSQALIIASPEYAHGITGSMKNALDWLVSFEGFVDKPVALVNTSPRARHAYEATVETLTTMSARVLVGPAFTIPLLANCTTEEAMLASPEASLQIRQMMASLVDLLGVCN